jgi:hypothetical protein
MNHSSGSKKATTRKYSRSQNEFQLMQLHPEMYLPFNCEHDKLLAERVNFIVESFACEMNEKIFLFHPIHLLMAELSCANACGALCEA